MKIILKLFSLKFVGALIGIAYTILQVKYFGASREIEIFFAAQSLVYLVTSLTQGGQLAEVFLPEYHKLNVIKNGLGFKALNVVINRMILYGSIIILFVFLLAPYFINILVPGYEIQEKQEATLIFRILLPYLYLQLAISFYKIVLNAEKSFGKPELLGIVNSVVNLMSLVLLYKYFGVWSLVISLLLGKLIEFIFFSIQLKKIGYSYEFILSTAKFNHVAFFKTIKSTMLYVLSTQFYSVILTAGISYLPVGTYAIFKYALGLALKVRGLLLQPFITVFFTEYSSLLQRSKSTINEFQKYLSAIINVNVISIIGTILLGDFIIDLIWGGEKFDSSDVKLAYVFLIFNILAMLITSLDSIYRKMAVSHHQSKKLYFFWVFSQLTSAALSYILLKNFKVNGLYFIMPINAFLMGVVSYIIYKRTKNSANYNFINFNNLVALVIIVTAVIIKVYTKTGFPYNSTHITMYIISVMILSLYPILKIYNLFKTKKEDINAF